MIYKSYVKRVFSCCMSLLIIFSLLLGMIPTSIKVSAMGEEKNIAEGKLAVASSELGGYPAVNAVNGVKDNIDGWVAGDGSFPQWLQIDLGAIYRLSTIRQTFADTNRTFKYIIEGSLDGETWIVLADRSDGITGGPEFTEQIDGSCRYVKLTVEDINNGSYAASREFEVYGERLEDVALNKSATASSSTKENIPEYAVNGKGIAESGGWVAGGGSFPQWLKIDLGDMYELVNIRQTFADKDGSTFKYKIEGAIEDLEWDSEGWNMLADRTVTGVTTSDTITEEVSGSYRYILFTITDINNGHWANSRAFEVYGIVPQKSATAEEIANKIAKAGITSPDITDTILKLPAVPEDFTVSIKSVNPEGVIALDGQITVPQESTDIEMVLTVTRISDGSAADTTPITVNVKSSGTLEFQIDAAAQADGSSLYRHVDNMMCLSNAHPDTEGKKILNGRLDFQDNPATDFSEGWADERYNEIFQYALYNWAVTSNDERPDGGYTEVDGKVGYIDWNGLKEQCRIYVDGGLKPWLMFQGVPEPISAGGYRSGPYSYNLSQPSDYDKWFQYLQAVMQYLVDEFGKEEVATWGFCFWSEAFGQFDAFNPETGSSTTEFIKMYDYWVAALESVLGEGKAYTGVYFDIPQRDGVSDFIEHCAKGTNYYSGDKGSRLTWLGYSNWPNGGYGSNANIINANNFVSYYDLLDSQVKKYPSLDNTDFVMVESGYLVIGEGGIPDLTYAENYGASYYAWRMDNYTKMPRLKSCVSFYNITTGEDVYESGWGAKNNWEDNMLVPSLHSWKISQMMENERRLPVATEGKPGTSTNIVGCIPTAADDEEHTYRILLYNACANPNMNAGEKITVKLDGIPGDNIKISKYLIDKTHNNWWTDWTNYRQQENIPYIMRGHGVGLNQEQASWHKNVWETTDEEGYQKWLGKIPEYKAIQNLEITEPEITIGVTDGSAEWTETLPGHSVMYIEVSYNETDPVYVENLDFEAGDLEDWSIAGLAEEASISRNGEFSAKLTAKPDQDAVIIKTISGLEPNTSYVLSGYGKPEGSAVKYRLFSHNPGESRNWAKHYSQGLLSSFGNWNNMAVTKKTDENGELVIGCWVVSDSVSQTAYFDDLKLQRAGNGMPQQKNSISASYKKLTSASSEKAGYEADNAIDGNDTTAWTADQMDMPQWLLIDLCGTYTIELIEHDFADEVGSKYKYLIEGSMDNESWTTLVDRTEEGVSADSIIHERVKGTCRYVRLTITNIDGKNPASCKTFEVYGKKTDDVAFCKIATASGANSGNEPERAFDGTTGWVANSPNYPQWLQVDLLDNYNLHTIKQTFGDDDNSTFKYYIEGSLDNENWDILADHRQAGITTRETITSKVTGTYRYVKMTVTDINNGHWANSRAFQIYGDPVIEAAALQDLVSKAEALEQGNFSDESWNEFIDVLADAKALLGNIGVQEQVDKMLERLQRVIDNLKSNLHTISTVADRDVSIYVQDGKTEAEQGETVDFKVEITNQNKELKAVTVKDSEGNVLAVEEVGNSHRFTMPDKAVTIGAVLKDKIVQPPVPNKRVTEVKLDKNNVDVYTGCKFTLKAFVLPENAINKAVKWKSSDPSIAKVDQNGVVKGVKAGSVKITVLTIEGSKEAVCNVVVKQKITGLSFKTPGYTLTKKGQKVDLSKYITVSPKNATSKKVTWKSSNKKVATVNSKGIVTLKQNKGNAIITATAKDGSKKKANITVVYGNKIKKIQLSSKKIALKKGKSTTLKATIANPRKPAYKKIVWSSSNIKVVSVSSKGKIKALKKGRAVITALAGDGSGIKKKITVTVW